jgi:pilus assembly protein CpaF
MRSLLIQEGRTSVEVRDVAALVDGYGAIDELMNDPAVTDILVNGVGDVWVERDGALGRTDVEFASEEDLAATIERLIARGGGRVDISRPIADVALPDGSRMHVVVPPLSPTGPKVAIRRFPRTPLSLDDLEQRDMFDAGVRSQLEAAVRERATIAISGGTGTGKTTLLNALLGEIPSSERLLTLEETPELRPTCAHWVPLVARPPNVEGKGEVTLVDLFRGALRMRPDRIVVGEVRGAEARVALDAFSTGHPGSLVTLHASSAADVVERFVALASASDVPDATLRTRVRDTFDLVVHIERAAGVRRVVELLSP